MIRLGKSPTNLEAISLMTEILLTHNLILSYQEKFMSFKSTKQNLGPSKSGITILRAAGMLVAGMRAAGHRLPAIVYVKPKICDQCYYSYYPPLHCRLLQ